MPSLENRVVLFVEDDEDSRELLADALTRYGASVIAVESASHALEVLRTRHPDVLVSDLEMNGMSGNDLMRRIRQHEQFANIPGIALTGRGSPSDRDAAFSAGFAKHLLKPIRTTDLVAAILALELRERRMPGDAPRDIRELLADLSTQTPCRYTSLLRFTEDDRLASVWTHDRESPVTDAFPLGLPVEASYCVLVRQSGAGCTVENARIDSRTTKHPKRDELAAYVGVPVYDAEGKMFGTLCSYDAQPQALGARVQTLLEDAVARVEAMLRAMFVTAAPAT
jgi:CheY-like chemotaxis protein